MTNKTIFGIAALAALIATPALAADLAVKAAPRAPLPWLDRLLPQRRRRLWLFQAGATRIRSRHRKHSRRDRRRQRLAGHGRRWLRLSVQSGSGWGNWVVGAFADYNFMDLRGHLAVASVDLVGAEKESSAWAAGGRIGYLVTPQILAYVNGGWSSTRFNGVSFIAADTGAATGVTLPSHNFNGGFIGTGTEIAVAFPGLYWRSEYRYASYRAADLQFFTDGAPSGLFNHESKTVQTITTSLVWKFH